MEDKLMTAGVMLINLVWLCVQTYRVWTLQRCNMNNG